jgi:hypothetical protein
MSKNLVQVTVYIVQSNCTVADVQIMNLQARSQHHV